MLLYHAGVHWVPGGFLGVDLFFVISGYLITSLLIAEVERTGGISFAGFFRRRARRLLPANPQVAYNLGTSHHDQGELLQAVGCYHEALHLRPGYADAGTRQTAR